MPEVDPSFLALPFRSLGDLALARAADLGATHADFRFERIRSQRNWSATERSRARPTLTSSGFAVRVIHGGAWGFASGVVLTDAEAAGVAETAVSVAKVAAAMTTTPVELAPEPVYDDVTWVSSYDVDPFGVPTADKTAVLADWTARLRAAGCGRPRHRLALAVQENKYYADLAGTRTTQQRVRLQPGSRRWAARRRCFDSMASIAPPVGARLGVPSTAGPSQLGLGRRARRGPRPARRQAQGDRPSRPARYDLVIHPSNLWLTIHESIGHATELDRALGYEANYAGTSFATPDQVGSLRYGSPVMQVTGDRTVEHGLATIGYDDDGVATQQWDIVRDGALVGFQLDRPMGRADAGAQRRPVQRLRLRRLPRPHPDPADGQRVAAARAGRPQHRGADRAGRARPLRRRRQVVVDRHAAVQLPVHRPAVLPDRRRPARRPGARRGLPGDDHRLLGLDGGGRRARRRGCSAARSTAARRNPGRSPRSATAARPRCSATYAS